MGGAKRWVTCALLLWVCTVTVAARAQPRSEVGHDRASARRLASEGRYVEALALFEPLAAASPTDWQLVCETAFVALEAGDVARASHLMSDAISEMHVHEWTAPLEPRAASACHYNAGRVAEAAGQLASARRAYAEASEARASAAADRRVAALDARLRGQPTLAALTTEICRQMFDWPDCVLDDHTFGLPEDGEPGDTDEADAAPPVDHGPLERVALVHVIRRPVGDDGSFEPSELALHNPQCVAVVAHDPGGWALVGRASPSVAWDRSPSSWTPGRSRS